MATQRAFYSLQGAGVNYGRVQLETAVKIYHVAVGSVLTCGCSAIYMSQSNMKSLNIIQNNQLKYIVGLKGCPHWMRMCQVTEWVRSVNVSNSVLFHGLGHTGCFTGPTQWACHFR